MTLAAGITLGITIATFLCGIFYKVVGMGKDNGKLAQRVDSIESRTAEDRERNEKNFTELFARTNTAEQNITALNTKVDNLTSLCSRMDTKLDRIIEGANGTH